MRQWVRVPIGVETPCCFTDGLTNNAAERASRGFALGRKSWLLFGSDGGVERGPATITRITMAKLNDVDPLAWLANVPARIAETSKGRLPELLLWNWRSAIKSAA
jgi:hypothetical protein